MEWINEILFSIFIAVPETMLVLLIGFALCNIRVALNKMIFVSIIQSIVAFIVKVVDIRYGLHTIVLLGALWLLVILILQVDMHKSMLSVLAGFFVQGVIQLIFYSITTYLFSEINIETLRTDFKISVLFMYTVFFFSIVLMKIIKKKKITFVE